MLFLTLTKTLLLCIWKNWVMETVIRTRQPCLWPGRGKEQLDVRDRVCPMVCHIRPTEVQGSSGHLYTLTSQTMKAWGTLLALSLWCPFHHPLYYRDMNRRIKHQLFANRNCSCSALGLCRSFLRFRSRETCGWALNAESHARLVLCRQISPARAILHLLKIHTVYLDKKYTYCIFGQIHTVYLDHVCMCMISLFSLEVSISVCHNKVSIMKKVIIISIHKFLWRLKSRSIEWGKERSMHSVQGRKKNPLYGWPLLSTFRCCTFFEIWLKE